MQIQDALIRPKHIVHINGIDVSTEVISIDITQSGHQEPHTLAIDVANSNLVSTENSEGSFSVSDFEGALDSLIGFHKAHIHVWLGYDNDTMELIFNGYSDSIIPSESKQDGNRISIKARSLCGKLIDAKVSTFYQSKSVEFIVRDLINKSGIPVSQQRYNIPAPFNEIPYGTEQDGFGICYEIEESTYWEVITKLASDIGLDVYFDIHENFYFGVYEGNATKAYEFDFQSKFIRDNGSSFEIYKDDTFLNCSTIAWELNSPNSLYNRCELITHTEDDNEFILGFYEHIPHFIKQGDSLAGVTQLATLKVENQMLIFEEMAKVQAMMRLWENQRNLFLITISSNYGIQEISPCDFINITNHRKSLLNGLFWIRNISHKYTKDSGYSMDICAEVPPYNLIIRN